MFGPRRGVAYAEGLRRSILRLGRFPRSAPIRPGFSAAIRIMPYRSHIVLYEIDPGGVHILRIRHAHEDWLGPIR